MGRSLRATALTALKTSVLTPTPSASERIARNANPGLRRRPRSAYRRSVRRSDNSADAIESRPSAMSHRSVAAPRVVNIEDLRRAAKRRLPRAVFDYIDGGAEAETTLRENCSVFERIAFRPRCAVAIADTQLGTRILGLPPALPMVLAPVGSSRMFYPQGEVGAARRPG